MVLLVAVCMVLTVAPRLTEGFLPKASADTVNYQVPSGTAASGITTQLATYASGTTVNVLLSGDVTLDASIEIPSGLTVNLYMNGKTLSRTDLSDSKLSGFYAITNNGTLNLYSGSDSQPVLMNGSGTINLTNSKTGMKRNSVNEEAYADLAGIKNSGTLTVNKGIVMNIGNSVGFSRDGDNKYNNSVNVGATGVYNTSNSASVVLNAVQISCSTYSCTLNANALTHTNRAGSARALSYGVYGGMITVNGACKFSTTSEVSGNEGASSFDEGTAKATAIAIDICSSQPISVNGGEFSYRTKATHDHDGFKNATLRSFCAGIAYSTVPPVLSDGDIDYNVNDGYGKFDQVGRSETAYIFEATVAKLTTLPVSGYNVANDSVFRGEGYDYNLTGTNSAGQYYDEAGNIYGASAVTADETRATKIVRGANDGLYRVHVIYRFWTDKNKNTVDTSIVGNDGNVGYSYKPLGDGTNVVAEKVVLSGVYNTTTLQKNTDSGIGYSSGGASKNNYYWKQYNMAYASTSAWFSDYDVTASNHKGTVFKSFVDSQNGTAGAGSAAPIYIFVDYYREDAVDIGAEVGANNSAAVTYTGDNIKASSFNLKIRNLYEATDYTADYDIDFTDSSKIPVSFTWTGTSGGASVSGSGKLPTDAGTYQVTLNIADDSQYDPNNCSTKVHKNRKALEYNFTLTINQASVSRGNLPENVSYIYGKRLNEALTLNSYVAKGVKNEVVAGSFSFTNSNDGTAFKPVGSGAVSLTFTPGASSKNYRETTFTVAYTVTQASIVISPKAAKVVYGETEFTTPYSIAVTGLVGNDNTTDVINQIAASIDYMILVNGAYTYYNPDDIGVGAYNIRGRVKQAEIPAVLNNYTYSYADLVEGYDVNQLTVTKRGLTVTAAAVSREYNPDNYAVNVTYEVADGRYGADDVRFTTGTGSINPNTAGTQIVYGATNNAAASCMTGAKAGNYQIDKIVYTTGASLTVEIQKATPDVSTPTVADMYYQMGRTLNNVPLQSNGSSVAGTWQWAAPSTNPTVNVKTYTAKFVPTDSVNYNEKYVDVTVKVIPTPVKVTYNGTVEYGDDRPNITAYSYVAEQDPTFNPDNVETEGNITPSTDYTKGSPVKEGGYAVEIALAGYVDRAGNYTFTAENGTITVVPRTIVFTVPSQTISYGDNFVPTAANSEPTCDQSRLVGNDTLSSITSDGSNPVWNYSTDYRYNDNYQVGSYAIRATKGFTTSPNYTVEVVNGTLTVAKAPLTIKAKNVTLPYNSDVPANLATSYTFVGAKRSEGLDQIVSDGEIRVSTNYLKGSPVSAEGYPISVDISGATINNYTVTVENGRITVVKATPVIRTYPTASIVYGQTLADAVFTGGVVDNDVPGAFVYNAASTKPAYSNEPYTNYTASFIPEDTANYNSVGSLTIALTVNKMPVTGNLAVTGIPMVTETLTVDVSGMNPSEQGAYTFTWTMNGAAIATGSSLVLTNEHENKTITVTATAQGYYEGEKSYTITAVAPKLRSVADIINADSYNNYFDLEGLTAFGGTTELTYNAQPHSVTLKQKAATLNNTVVGAVTVKYNGSTEIPVNAGLYTVTVDVATPDLPPVNDTTKTTYSPATGLVIGTLKINKAAYDVTVTVADKVYDGTNTAVAANVVETGAMTAGGVQDDVSFDAARAIYTFADANVGNEKEVNAGNTVLKGAAASNYELNFTLGNDAKASITPRTLNVRVDPVEREYQEDYYAVDLAFIIDVSTIAPADTSSSVYVDEAQATGRVDDYHAGTRRVTVSNVLLAGPKKDNYVLNLTNLDNLTVAIEKATPSYPIPYTGTVYYDSGRTLSNISLGDSRWSWATSVANEIPGAGDHIYTAVYTPDDTDNFASVNYEVFLKVLPAPVVVKVDSLTTIYGDFAPTYRYTVTGLTGADTIKNAVGGYVLLSCSYEPGTNVGTYAIIPSGEFTSDNYTFTYQNGTLTVNPRPVYVTASAANRAYEQGNLNVTVTFSALSNVYAGDGSNVYLTSQTVTGTIANENAGIKSVDFAVPELGGNRAGNYTLTLLNPDLKVEIEKAVLQNVVLPKTGTVNYGAKLSTTVFGASVGADLGTFTMENPMSTPAAVGTTSDVYKVVFTPFNAVNYATISDYITLTVLTADLNVELSLSGSTDVGKKLYVATNNLPEDAYQYIEYKWYRLDTRTGDVRDGQLVASGTTEYTVTEKDADHYIVCVATNKANSPYNINARVSSDSTVSKKSMSLWERLLKWFYRVLASITQLFGKIK